MGVVQLKPSKRMLITMKLLEDVKATMAYDGEPKVGRAFTPRFRCPGGGLVCFVSTTLY